MSYVLRSIASIVPISSSPSSNTNTFTAPLLDKLNFEDDAAKASWTEFETYKQWKNKDDYLMTWLLSSIDSSFKNRMLDYGFAHEVCFNIQDYFSKISKIKVQQLKAQLKSIKKKGTFAAEYLNKIRKL
ncbi:hypothetical protein AHAS_Ahas13G0216400 [Arachis hypogaea]